MKKAFTLIELLIVVAIIAILAAIAVPNFLEAQVRAKVSRVKSDQRTYSTALETYYIDNNTYPDHYFTGRAAIAGAPGENVNSSLPGLAGTQAGELRSVPSFQARGTSQLGGLTTPVSYLSSFVPDTFADVKSATFGYMTIGSQYLVWSPGPDADAMGTLLTDLGHTPTGWLVTLLSSGASLPSPTLLGGKGAQTGENAFTYDPTNGTSSGGDVWRVKG